MEWTRAQGKRSRTRPIIHSLFLWPSYSTVDYSHSPAPARLNSHISTPLENLGPAHSVEMKSVDCRWFSMCSGASRARLPE